MAFPARTSKRRFRVLVVDDDRAALVALEGILADEFEVTTCASAERALELIARETFHVVCTDFQMPKMSGEELLQRVAEQPHFAGRLLVTGASDYVASSSKGQHYVLLKPYDPERLLRMVQQLARLAEMKRSVGTLGGELSRPSSSNGSNGTRGRQ